MNINPFRSTSVPPPRGNALPCQSKQGIASFTVALSSSIFTVWSVLFIAELVSLLAVAAFLVPLIGICLGVASLTRKNCRHGLAIAGLIVNASIFLLATFYVVAVILVMAMLEDTAF